MAERTILKNLSIIAVIFSLLFSSNTLGHRYFFSLTEIRTNEKTQHLEVIHELSLHDLEYAIALAEQIDFSPDTANYNEKLQAYIEENFSIEQNGLQVSLHWIGLDLTQEKAVFYQESKESLFLKGLVVKNHLLVDTYPTQVNIVNYQYAQETGSLTFTKKQRINSIK